MARNVDSVESYGVQLADLAATVIKRANRVRRLIDEIKEKELCPDENPLDAFSRAMVVEDVFSTLTSGGTVHKARDLE